MAEFLCRKRHLRWEMVLHVITMLSLLASISSIVALAPIPDFLETKNTPVASEISGNWLEAIEEDIRASEYQVTWQDQTYSPDMSVAYQSPNRVQNLRVYINSHGLTLIPRQWEQGKTTSPWR